MALASAETSESQAAVASSAAAASSVLPADPQAAEVVARLSGTQWAIELSPMFGEKPPQPVKDVLSFSGDKMASEHFAETGFLSSKFTLTVGEDGAPVWEATQLNQQEGIILWKGEVHGQTVQGVVSQHPLKGSTQDFVFIGEELARAGPTSAQANASVSLKVAPSATSVAPATPSAVDMEPAPQEHKDQ